MRYYSKKGIALQFVLNMIFAAVVAGVAAIVMPIDLFGLIFPVFLFGSVVRDKLASRFTIDFPKKKSAWIVGILLLCPFLLIGTFGLGLTLYELGLTRSSVLKETLALPLFIAMVAALPIKDLIILRPLKKRKAGEAQKRVIIWRKTLTRFYSAKGFVIRFVYNCSVPVILCLLLLVMSTLRSGNSLQTIVFALLAVAVILLFFLRDLVLYRCFIDYPKRNARKTIVKSILFLAIFVATALALFLIFEEAGILEVELPLIAIVALVVLLVQFALRDYFLIKSTNKKREFSCPYCFKSAPVESARLVLLCPHCHNSLTGNSLFNNDMAITVVGSSNSGKSFFIGVMLNGLVERMKSRGHISGLGDTMDRFERDYRSLPGNAKAAHSAVEVSFASDNKGVYKPLIFEVSKKPNGAKHSLVFYDTLGIDEKYFTATSVSVSHGVVLVIDPFSISSVMSRYGTELNASDKKQISEESADSTIGSFIQALEHTTELLQERILSTPLAIVINKVDMAGLDLVIGEDAIQRTMEEHPKVFANHLDTMDYVCREFLSKMDMRDVVAHIQQNFKCHRFFALSTHSQNDVAKVFDWIIRSNENGALASLVTTSRFSKRRVPIDSDVETIDLTE